MKYKQNYYKFIVKKSNSEIMTQNLDTSYYLLLAFAKFVIRRGEGDP